MFKHQTLILSAVFLAFAVVANARPYFYFQQEAAPPAPAPPAVVQAGKQVQQATENIAAQSGQLPDRITGHLNQLYTHGSTAVKSLADTMQPDIKNIGHDLTDVYQVTKQKVNQRMEPLAQTVRPYIDQAHKVVAPYVESAKEEVPKLIHQAGPAISKVSEQMRGGITEVWNKLTATGQQAAQDASGQIQQAAQGAQQATTNAIQAESAPAPMKP